jgi:hypothetical protein
MLTKISLNLDIQTQCLDILCNFLKTEYEALQSGEIFDVYQLEKSIRVLLKMLRSKREELAGDLMGVSVRDFASGLPGHTGDLVYDKLDRLAKIEQECLDKASRNADLSLVLSGQRQVMLDIRNVYPADRTAEGWVQ